MTTRRMLIVAALLALAAPGAAAAAVSNGPVGWTEATGPHSGRWLSRGLTDFRATVHSERVGINGVYSPNGALFATLLGSYDDRLTLLDGAGDNRGTLVTSAGPPAYARDLVADWSKDGRLILLLGRAGARSRRARPGGDRQGHDQRPGATRSASRRPTPAA